MGTGGRDIPCDGVLSVSSSGMHPAVVARARDIFHDAVVRALKTVGAGTCGGNSSMRGDGDGDGTTRSGASTSSSATSCSSARRETSDGALQKFGDTENSIFEVQKVAENGDSRLSTSVGTPQRCSATFDSETRNARDTLVTSLHHPSPHALPQTSSLDHLSRSNYSRSSAVSQASPFSLNCFPSGMLPLPLLNRSPVLTSRDVFKDSDSTLNIVASGADAVSSHGDLGSSARDFACQKVAGSNTGAQHTSFRRPNILPQTSLFSPKYFPPSDMLPPPRLGRSPFAASWDIFKDSDSMLDMATPSPSTLPSDDDTCRKRVARNTSDGHQNTTGALVPSGASDLSHFRTQHNALIKPISQVKHRSSQNTVSSSSERTPKKSKLSLIKWEDTDAAPSLDFTDVLLDPLSTGGEASEFGGSFSMI